MTQPAAELRFVKGDATLGDVCHLCDQILKRFRTSTRMQGWSITQHAYAISSYCDDVTRTAIEDTIADDVFDCGEEGSGVAADRPRPRRFTVPPLQAIQGDP